MQISLEMVIGTWLLTKVRKKTLEMKSMALLRVGLHSFFSSVLLLKLLWDESYVRITFCNPDNNICLIFI